MSRALVIAALVVALVACGGPSVAKLHDAHRGQTNEQIRTALGDPVNSEFLPTAEGAPTNERWIYTKAKALGVADDGTYVAVEFVGGKEDRMYELDQQQYKQAFSDGSTDDAVKQLESRVKPAR